MQTVTAKVVLGVALLAIAPQVHAQRPAPSGSPADLENDTTQSQGGAIVVTGVRPRAVYVAESSDVFGFGDLTIQEIPQSVQVLTRDFIDDSGALSLGELMQNVPGASNALARTTPFGTGSLQIRGQDVAIFRDGLRDIDFSEIDQSALNNVARVDVLKGPAGLVFGTGGPGGVVNIVTKRPLERLAANATLTLGERNTFILAGDVSVPLGSGLGVRVTGEVERSDSFIDFSEVERDNFSAVLAYDAGGPFKASVVYENFANRDDNAFTRVGLPTSGTIVDADIVRIDRNIYLGEPAYDFTDSYGTMLSAYLSYAISDAVSLEAAGRRTTVHFDQAEIRTLGALNRENLTVRRSRARELLLDEEQYNARALVRGEFATGPVTHDVTIGYEYFDFDLFVDTRSVSGAQVTPISVVDPVYRDQPLVAGTPFVFTTNDRSNEVFVQDVVRFGPLTATGAIRKIWSDFSDSFGLEEQLDQTLYQIGAAYEVVERVSVFAGYNTGFDANSDIAVERSRTGDRFDPENYRQVEIGVKTDALAGLTATASLFELTREGILVTDRADAAFLVQVGEERSRGFEADVLWAPTPELALRAGYLYLDSEITEDTDQTRIGNRRPGAPEHRANGFASYTFLSGPFQNLRLSAGITYVGDAFASLNNGIERPDYTLVDFGASYAVGRFRLDAFLSNAFDERYFIARNDATVNAGDPQFFRLRANVEF